MYGDGRCASNRLQGTLAETIAEGGLMHSQRVLEGVDLARQKAESLLGLDVLGLYTGKPYEDHPVYVDTLS